MCPCAPPEKCPLTNSKSFVIHDWIGLLASQANEPKRKWDLCLVIKITHFVTNTKDENVASLLHTLRVPTQMNRRGILKLSNYIIFQEYFVLFLGTSFECLGVMAH